MIAPAPTGTFRVFASNDDGLFSPGMIELARRLSPLAELTIVAPDGPRSAASHSITLHKPLRLEPAPAFPWPPDAREPHAAYTCSGSPTDCVMLGVLEILKERPPHLVVSGINDGQNLAEDLTYSGTVAAAMEAAILGLPAIALSLDHRGEGHFATASHFLVELTGRVFFADAREGAGAWNAVDTATLLARHAGKLFLNVNVPDLPAEQVKGLKLCRTGFRGYRDVVRKMRDPRGRPFFWIAGERVLADVREGSDVKALEDGWVAVTPLTWELSFQQGFGTLGPLLE